MGDEKAWVDDTAPAMASSRRQSRGQLVGFGRPFLFLIILVVLMIDTRDSEIRLRR